jgi:hypothetical protein
MFESYELPGPDEITGLDELGLVDAVAIATLMESAASEVRLAAMKEMYVRLRPSAPAIGAHPRPPRNRQRRRNRKRRRRR